MSLRVVIINFFIKFLYGYISSTIPTVATRNNPLGKGRGPSTGYPLLTCYNLS